MMIEMAKMETYRKLLKKVEENISKSMVTTVQYNSELQCQSELKIQDSEREHTVYGKHSISFTTHAKNEIVRNFFFYSPIVLHTCQYNGIINALLHVYAGYGSLGALCCVLYLVVSLPLFVVLNGMI